MAQTQLKRVSSGRDTNTAGRDQLKRVSSGRDTNTGDKTKIGNPIVNQNQKGNNYSAGNNQNIYVFNFNNSNLNNCNLGKIESGFDSDKGELVNTLKDEIELLKQMCSLLALQLKEKDKIILSLQKSVNASPKRIKGKK